MTEKQQKGTNFSSFLKEKRMKLEITLEQLSEGLCSASELARIEAGIRAAGRVLRNSLLYRLGISPDAYENFLFQEDYTHWQKRQQLLYAVSRNDLETAAELLHKYREHYVSKAEKGIIRRLEQQFCLSMEAQILRNSSGSEEPNVQEKLKNLFGEALKLTVVIPLSNSTWAGSEIDSDGSSAAPNLQGKIYSVQELNLLLETIRYGHPQDWETCFREILCLISEARFDTVSLAKIYPKAVYYLCREALAREIWGLTEKMEAIALCEKAVHFLRQAGRMYYLWELLGVLKRLIKDTAAGQRAGGAEQKAAELEKRISEYNVWTEALEAVYEEFGVSKETRDFCWLYVEKEVYCINKVIRIRREMLGISRQQLCGDGVLCSEKTLKRLEKEGKKIQKGIAEELMKRLNLSAEYCQTELVTDDPEALDLMNTLRDKIRNWESEEADLLLEQLQKRISLEIPFNRQLWMRCHIINEAHKGSMSKEQCVERIREVLAITLPYETAVKPGEKYLTNQEINCIQNMVCWEKGMDEEKKKQLSLLESQYEACKREKNIFCFINMYEIIMGGVASELGNMEEYDRSDEISRTIITECLYQRRAVGIHGEIYNRMWNNEQRQKRGIPVQRQCNPEEELKRCIVFSVLSMDGHDKEFYRKKLRIREQEPH